MSKKQQIYHTIILLLFLTSIKPLYSQNRIWTDGTAFTIPHKKLEISLFRPWKYGLTKKSELSVHPIGIIGIPHLFYKKRWIKFKLFKNNFMLSSRHGLYYPYPALKYYPRIDSARFTSSSTQIPHSLAMQNELIISHFVNEPSHCNRGDKLITGKIGFKYSYNFDKPDSVIIYRSVLFRETSVLNPKFIWYVGIDFDASLNTMLNYFVDLDFYSVGLKIDAFSIESKFGIMGYLGKHWSAFGGLKTGFSTMISKRGFFIFPLAGISYTFTIFKKKKKAQGLFGKKIYKYQNTDIEGEIKYIKNPNDTIQNSAPRDTVPY